MLDEREMELSYRRCFVLVDWWGQVRSNFNNGINLNDGRKSESALRSVESLVQKRLLMEEVQPTRWDVMFRLYSGWMSGSNKSDVLKDYDKMCEGYAKPARIGDRLRNVLFMPANIGMSRGDRLLSDEMGKRVDKRLGIHFPFTFRSECKCPLCNHLNRGSPDGFVCKKTTEKQVDTSIVADAITLSLRRERAKIIIVSNDDDVFPALIAGEALGGDISLVNSVQKNNIHANQILDMISGPKELGE